MKLSEFKNYLKNLSEIQFKLPTGKFVPGHFHVTEVGVIARHFIDCGGKERVEKSANCQLWITHDTDHKLKPAKLLGIIQLSERKLAMTDMEVEVEYQSETIGRYEIGFDGTAFLLLSKRTACLAEDQCGISEPIAQKQAERVSEKSYCSPNDGCC